jgi:hypothetical protein
VAIRRRLPDGVKLREARFCDAVLEELRVTNAVMVAMEVTEDNVDRFARDVARIEAEFPDVPIVALGKRELEPAQWWLRELGVDHYLSSRVELDGLLQVVERYAAGVPVPEADTALGILPELPWSTD